MSYEMRALKTSDIFKMSKILKKMGIKIEIEEKTTQIQLGAQFIQKIAENLHMAEEEVNEFLGNLIGIKAKAFSELPLEETMEVIDLFKGQKSIDAFFKLASK